MDLGLPWGDSGAGPDSLLFPLEKLSWGKAKTGRSPGLKGLQFGVEVGNGNDPPLGLLV